MPTTLNTERNNRTASFFLLLFGLALIGELVATSLHADQWRWLSKPLLMPALAGYFLTKTPARFFLRTWIILALFFSWIGDIFLQLQDILPVSFMIGLGAFLIAHIFYIVFFHRLRVTESISPRGWLLPIIVVYYAVLIGFLSPYLAALKIPVSIYGVVICFMLLLALHMTYIRKGFAGRYMMMGALLFVLSDSLLAINKFYQPISFANTGVMLTYGMAQYFIVEGAVRYSRAELS